MHFPLQATTIDCFTVKIKFSDGYFSGHFFFLPFYKWQGYKLHFISDGLMSLVCGPSDAFLFPLSLQPPYDTKRSLQRRENRRAFLSLPSPFCTYSECNPTKGKLPYEGDRGIND